MADGYKLSVILPRGFHPFPSRTRKLSPAGPMVLHAKVCGRVGSCRHKIKATFRNERGLFLALTLAVKKSLEKLFDRRQDKISLDEVERIAI